MMSHSPRGNTQADTQRSTPTLWLT